MMLNNQGELMGPNGEIVLAGGSSRSEFAALYEFARIGEDVKAELDAGRMKLTDGSVYSVKEAKEIVDFFQSQDKMDLGLQSIASGELPKNRIIVASSIQLEVGVPPVIAVAGSPTEAEIKNIEWKPLTTTGYGGVRNGHITLELDKQTILAETSCSIFSSGTGFIRPDGRHKLENFRIIREREPINCTLQLATAAYLPANSYFRFSIIGAMSTK